MPDVPLIHQSKLTVYGGDEKGARAYCEFEFEGVVYAVEVIRDDAGRVTQTFFTTPPPAGLDAVRYQWYGRPQWIGRERP